MRRALTVVGFAAAVGFALLARQVLSGAADAFDHALMDAIQVRVSPAIRWFLLGFSRLGQGDVLTIATAIAAIVCLRRRNRELAAAWTITMLGGFGLTQLLKFAIGRARPRYAEPWLTTDYSFPSGHTSMTLVFVGFGLYLFLRRERSAFMRVAAVTLASVWCLLMGMSRLLLGNHYLSDVLGGYLMGIAWLAGAVGAMEGTSKGTWRGTKYGVLGNREVLGRY